MTAARAGTARDAEIVVLGEGTDHVAHLVGGWLVVRQLKERDRAWAAARVRHECGLLAAVAEVAPVPVPAPLFEVPELGCTGHRLMAGESLLDVRHRAGHARDPRAVAAVGHVLGRLVRALHDAPAERFAPFVVDDDVPMGELRDEAAEQAAAVCDALPPRLRPRVAAFLASAPPPGPGRLRFAHNDLGIEHVLVDPRTWAVEGVIDWSDASFTDPVADFARLLRDLGWAALRAALQGYGDDRGELRAASRRILFRARCGLLEDLAWGLQQDDARYVDKSLAGADALFGDPAPTR
jgi:aminoglycoside phosphotransferase (APT) family kinase protein